MDNFPRGLASQGVPLFGTPGLVAMSGGQVFFVDPTSTIGSDGYEGSSDRPMATIEAAYAKCVDGRGDIVVLKGGPASGGGTGQSARLTASFDWAKNNTHLIGLCAPTAVGQRARITGPSSGGTFSPVMTLSGGGCRIANISIFDDYTVDPVALKVTGQRNYFNNVNLQGMGAATGADDAAGASLWIAGGAENTFDNCVIGLDTIPRSAANAEIRFTAAAKRNLFRHCDIVSYCDSATHLFVDANASGALDRWTTFRHCQFHNAPTGIASGLTMTNAMSVHASAGGYIYLFDCSGIGFTDWAAADNGNVFCDKAVAVAGTAGLAVAVTR